MLEINGKKYRLKNQEQEQKSTGMPPTLFNPMMLFSMGLGSMFGEPQMKKRHEKIDIVEEYKLIQDKKSKLSAADRRWVTLQFVTAFEEVTDEMLQEEEQLRKESADIIKKLSDDTKRTVVIGDVKGSILRTEADEEE